MTDLTLYVGAAGAAVRRPDGTREPNNETGPRCWTSAYRYKGSTGDFEDPNLVQCLLDSGAFSDPPDRRLTPELALGRALEWESTFSRLMGADRWRVQAIASYDHPIYEKWLGQERHLTEAEAKAAIAGTVEAAHYLASQRNRLESRSLVLGIQGAIAEQYMSCLEQVLQVAQPGDWIGIGGWALTGRPKFQHWLPELMTTLALVVPAIATAGLGRIHLFGCLYEPAIAPFAAICHKHGIHPSVDSTRPILDCLKPDPIRAGVRRPYWRDNVAWWRSYCAQISNSLCYRLPTVHPRQMSLLEETHVA